MTLPIIQTNVSLKPFNTLAVDVMAHRYVNLNHTNQLTELHQHGALTSVPFFLGGGSNILFTQPLKQLLIHNQLRGITRRQETATHVELTVASGENWHEFVCYCIEQGYHGLENLSLIPGTVGAAPAQNIGAYGVELKDHIIAVTVFDTTTGKTLTLDNTECAFDYRDSIFKQSTYQHWFITAITLRLDKTFTPQLDYPTLSHYLQTQSQTITASTVAKAVITIRQSKLPDPTITPNAGSFFKNPIISHQELQKLQQQNPSMPSFSINNNQYKIPAAWLIEQCQWKGKRAGNVSMHQDQAVVLVNHGNASGKALLTHTQHVAQSVKQRFNITLTPEVNIH